MAGSCLAAGPFRFRCELPPQFLTLKLIRIEVARMVSSAGTPYPPFWAKSGRSSGLGSVAICGWLKKQQLAVSI